MNADLLSKTSRQIVRHRLTNYLASIAVVLILVLLIELVSRGNHLLSIILIELISIAVAIAVFVIVWNSRRIASDSFLLAIGLSCLFTAFLDTLFTFSFVNLPLLPGIAGGMTPQFWIAARYFQAASLLIAVALIGRSLTPKGKYDTLILTITCAGIFLALVAGIVICHEFPDCSNAFAGPSLFKSASEYLISALFLITAGYLLFRRRHLDPEVGTFLVIAMLFFGWGELVFAISGNGIEPMNVVGFFIRFVAVYYLYRAIVTVGVTRPFDLLFCQVTEREHELCLSEERYRKIVETQTELISRFLPDGRHVFVNDAYCRFFGLTRDEILGKKMPAHCVVENLTDLRAIFSGLTPQKPVIADTCQVTRSDGSIRWVVWNDQAIFAPDGTVVEFQSVGRDITKLHEANEALEKAHEKLALLSGITRHDILNQLTGLKSLIYLVQNEPGDPEIPAMLKKMQNIANVIEDQISFTKDYEEMGVKAPVWQDVTAGIERAVAALPLGTTRVQVETGAVEVYADPLFEKVFYNLIDNSLKYGGKNLSAIRIVSQKTSEGLELVYSDNGEGIRDEDKKKLFSKGFGKHTGLGLFLVREILAITGIRIEETGTFGTGVIFIITVPVDGYRFIKE
ncbi:MASE3 domain-containing protein [Methanoregula sp. UBA64]|jgi:PAS domain S-box-containing protein|uniref:sensor histidine kinase n=1 Tax=Methanoregula sp. UBA64 TaxID=1915554 RepID=UPI0025DA3C72|nr:MASE3 domain-containing protein [Methanoregula sp. UBA64]